MLQTDLVAKELEVFKEALPQARRFGVVFASTAPSHVPALEAAETAARHNSPSRCATLPCVAKVICAMPFQAWRGTV
jgi:hypothetical protein